jgi:signal transduction histidine kinase
MPYEKGERIKLMVVEDNPADLLLIREMLALSSIVEFKIDHATRLSDAIRSINDLDHDAVLLDLNLPDSNGFETFAKLHDECPNIPVIIMTGGRDERVAIRAVNGGAQDYLFKDDINERNLAHSIMFAMQRKSIEKQVVEEKRRAELYIDLLTHDINNLNAAAMGYMQLIESKETNSGLRDYVSKSIHALEDSSELIDSVVKLQKSRAAGLERRDVDLVKLINEVIVTVPRPADRSVEMHVNSEDDARFLGSDLLRDVFANILTNAVKHSKGDVRIEVHVGRVRRKGRLFHLVSIEDNGPGVPDDMKERIFYRAQRGRTGAVGRGIGLLTSKPVR